MKLSLSRPYLSLVALPSQELPDFTLITGVNGAGKSHLLKALQNGAATCDAAPDAAHDVRLFDWTNLAPNGGDDFSSETIRQEQIAIFNQLKQMVDQPWGLQTLFQAAASAGIQGPLLSDAQKLLDASDNELLQATNGTRDPAQIKQVIMGASNQFENNLWAHIPQTRTQIEVVARASKKFPIALRQSDFLKFYQPAWGQAEIFQQSFGRLFVSYRDLYVLNRVAQMAKAEGDITSPALTEDEFAQRYGTAPWDFVNASLVAAGMNFTIDSPDRFSLAPYKPSLRKSRSDIEISFEGLSSGERVLMSFAFALYYASDNRQTIIRPKLLLLDEVDAPLHPSMCKSLLATIQQVLIKEQGLRVIMTTHSPSTVALAPDDAIHVMRPGQAGIHKTGKDAAISDLTDGVPTLSVFYDGRRQVFVESPKDVEVYQAAFNALKRHIDSDLSIIFIATGVESSAGKHMNTGCDAVKRIVGDMRRAGARHTLGLIDWDGNNRSENGIVVLCEGERDGLESVLFDPFLLLNTLIRQERLAQELLGIDVNYISLPSLDIPIIQRGVDEVQRRVLGRSRAKSAPVEYVGGLNLMVDIEYLTLDDHELESKVNAAFPQLKSISRNRIGELAKWIAQTVLNERSEHCPKGLLTTFQRIVQT